MREYERDRLDHVTGPGFARLRGVDGSNRAACAPRSAVVPFVARLAEHGDRVALIDDAGSVTYRELAQRIESYGAGLGLGRRLVLVTGENTVDSIVAYFSVLARGHVALLVSGEKQDRVSRLIATYDPDVVISARSGWAPVERRAGTGHTLHADLALVLSSSGTTGSERLVRLSQRNVQSNAEAIGEALGLLSSDRAITTLPLHYCYGLSVVHSHLLCGGSLVLTSDSVIEPSFWSRIARHNVTNFAGVPYTFELLDRAAFASRALPSLRLITQAGGRLSPEQVQSYARLGRRQGWDLCVMYGQTEATARMTVLPPAMALTHPASVGYPISGGSVALVPVEGCRSPDEGELVYRGPNVMLGYAEGPGDLAAGATLDALATGDLARRCPDGTYEIIGRRSRIAKPFGLRIDLDETERILVRHGFTNLCTGDDRGLTVALESKSHEPWVEVARVRDLLADEFGLPKSHIHGVPFETLPRLPSGKPDYVTIAHQGSTAALPAPRIGEIMARAFGRDAISNDASFTTLGGDSLSWVDVASGIEERLGYLPDRWDVRTIRELDALDRRSNAGTSLETGLFLRGLSILLVLGSHIRLFQYFRGVERDPLLIRGGAHVMLAVSGFAFARFLLSPDAGRASLTRRILVSAARIAVPSMMWIGALALFTHQYRLANVALLNYALGSREASPEWFFWYVEALVTLLVMLAAGFSIPAIRLIEGRYPFVFAMTLLVVALVPPLLFLDRTNPFPALLRPQFAAWVFCVGWVAQRATGARARVILSLLILLGVSRTFQADLAWGATVAIGAMLLVWVHAVPVPRWLGRALTATAGASLYIYLTHFQVVALLAGHAPPIVTAGAAVGLGMLMKVVAEKVAMAWRGFAADVRWMHPLSWRLPVRPINGR